ncbi:Ig-like domain-containing protein [Methanobacterium sp.]|uniref:Ig-like domain-containing protein n=1 Tax=Methanobacterium sp. TaxID=2164 RepID=UPI003C74ABE2
MTIKGQSKSGTIINGTNSARIFQIKKPVSTEPLPPEDINVILLNLTVVNSTNAISNEEGILTIKDCTFRGNTAMRGCALTNKGTCTITGSTFTNNIANNGNGGAIYNTGNLTVTNSAFTGNIYYSSPTTSPTTYKCRDIYNTGNLTAHFNQFVDYTYIYITNNRTLFSSINMIHSIYNYGGTVNADLNWWGNNKGPFVKGFTVNKWFVLKANANSSSVPINTNSKITADLRYDNYGTLHTESYLPNGIPVAFTTNLGTITSKVYTVNGIAQATLKSALGGTANVSVIADSQQLFKYVKIIDKVPPKVSSTYPKNNTLGFSRTATISIKFNEKIKASTYWSKIYVKNLNTGKIALISKWISGNTLYIKMSSRRYAYNWYQVYIPKAAVKDYFSNNLAAYYTFKFKTGQYPLNYQ